MPRDVVVLVRSAITIGALFTHACSSNPYVIGRYGDAGEGDGGADAGASECAGALASAVVCSGFETELAQDWSESLENQGILERSTSRAHSGSGSLHASSSAAMSTAVVAQTFTPRLSGELHLRAYVYVPADLATETMNLFFIGSEPFPDPFIGIDFNIEDGAVEIFSPQSNPSRHTGTLTIPRDRWFCFQARVSIGDNGSVEAFVDGELVVQTAAFDTLPAEGIDMLRAGVDWSSEQDEPFEVFIDDVVLDTSEVDCL